MKFLMIMVGSLFLESIASATVCPNISGSFSAGPTLYIGYEQTDCSFLKRYWGTVSADGSIDFNFDKQFPLDGTPICSSSGACESAQSTSDSIFFSLNFNGGVKTDDHGSCNHRGYQLSKDSTGSLIATFSVFACSDGFKGTIIKKFSKL